MDTIAPPEPETLQPELPAADSAHTSAQAVALTTDTSTTASVSQAIESTPVQSHTSVPAEYTEQILTVTKENPNAVIFGLGVIFLLFVLWLVARARKAELGLFRNAEGRVSVSRNALSDLVETVARGVPGTVKPRAFFRKRGSTLNVKLRVRLKGRRHLTGYTVDLQERISKALRNALGDEQVGQVDIIVTGFYDLGTREQPVDDISKDVEENMKDLI